MHHKNLGHVKFPLSSSFPHSHHRISSSSSSPAFERDSVWSGLKAWLGKRAARVCRQRPRGHARLSLSSGNSLHAEISLESNSSLRKGDRRCCDGVRIPTPWHHRLYSSLCIQTLSAARTMAGTDAALGIYQGEKKTTETSSVRVHSCESDVTLSCWASNCIDLKALRQSEAAPSHTLICTGQVFWEKITPFLASYHNSDPNDCSLNSSRARRWETFFIRSLNQIVSQTEDSLTAQNEKTSELLTQRETLYSLQTSPKSILGIVLSWRDSSAAGSNRKEHLTDLLA